MSLQWPTNHAKNNIMMGDGGNGVLYDATPSPFAAAAHNPAPFVTTKRRNPFGGACARPKTDKRMKLDGAAPNARKATLPKLMRSPFVVTLAGGNHAVAQRKRVVFAGIEFNTHVEPPAVPAQARS